MSSKWWLFVRRRPLFSLLIVCHVPMLLLYYRSLWGQTHYQFFPFALGAFAWLFATRRGPESEQWSWPERLLVAGDLICVCAGAYLFSPWLFAVGLFLTLTAWCLSNRDAGYRRSLLYLAILPLLTIRLPMQYDEQVIHGLQRVTTAVASGTLHRMEYLHYREGNILQFPGKSFLVEEACSGVQSVFTILFIAAIVICLKRRSLIHGAILLSTGIMIAAILNSLRVMAIAVAWESFAIDWSTGLSHDILGYVCLAVAAVLLMSADAMLGFLSDPVPDVRRPGAVGLFFNPFIRAWNKVVSVVPESESRLSRTDDSAAGPRKTSSTLSDAERREHPSTRDLLRPANWFHFALGGIESWIFSRNYRQLASGVPFALLVGVSVLFVWWLRHATVDPVIADLESAFNSAVADDDVSRQEIALRALGSLRPAEPQYRFRLALFMVQQGRLNEGLQEILALTPATALGYADARMWLVQQALQKQPLMPLNPEQIEIQLKAVLGQQPRNVEAHQLLAQIYADRKEWKLSESHLTEAAKIKPETNLTLAKLMRLLKRSDEAVKTVAQRAIDALTEKLQSNRADAATRISLAEATLVAGKEAEARELLVSGLQQKDDPQLRKALSDFDLMMVERRLAESVLNRDACVPVILSALKRDPSSVTAVQMISKMQELGAEFPEELLQPPVDYWESVINKAPDDAAARILLSQLLISCEQPGRAAEVLKPVVKARPEVRLSLARLLQKCNQDIEAKEILDAVRAEEEKKLAEKPGDPAATIRLCDVMILSGEAESARSQLLKFADDPAVSRVPSSPELATAYGRACLAIFDGLTGYSPVLSAEDPQSYVSPPDSADAEVLLELLSDAFECPGIDNQALDRLSRLSLSSHAAAAEAESMLRRLRLDGTHGSKILNLLGMHALLHRRYDKARPWLEQAYLQTRGRDPMILNNLATAIIRGGGDTKERALNLANETLTLLPDHPDALSTRGEVYVAMERWPEAIADLTQSLKLRQNSAEVHRLLQKAYAGIQDPQMSDEHRRRAEALEAATASAG